jgi:hypothetical protein
MASVMAQRLEKIANLKRVERDDVPKGIYSDVRELFRLVLQAADDVLPENPPASINAYVIALDAMMGAFQPLPKTRHELKDRLEEYSRLIERLGQSHTLDEQEVQTTKSLQKFFFKLHQDGESEAYEHRVYFVAPTIKLL